VSLALAIAGAAGRMGRALLEAAAATEGVRSARRSKPRAALGGRDAGDLAAGAKGVIIGSDIAAALKASDVLIDFTRPEGTLVHLEACRAAGTEDRHRHHRLQAARGREDPRAAKDIAIVFAPNMSIGVNVR
jgi:4-hydroxy-tetrahydrodipicolinate reductase